MNTTDLNIFWESFLSETQKKINPSVWERIIQTGLYPITLTSDILQIGTSTNYIRTFIISNQEIFDILSSVATTLLKRSISIEIYSTSLTVKTNDNTDFNECIQITNLTSESSKTSLPEHLFKPEYDLPLNISYKQTDPDTKKKISSSIQKDILLTNTKKTHELKSNFHSVDLNPSFTFENFIIGNSNRNAYATAQSIAESLNNQYNPFFIYGFSGLGKTHLIHAIGNRLKEKNPDIKIICITSETFTNYFISSLRKKENDSFRQYFRSADILLIDDIQFIQKKDFTEDEFFHTFNDLFNSGKQIVLTSDVPPKNMKNLKERLSSRFSSGFIVKIDPPDLETRIAILQFLIQKKFNVSDYKDIVSPDAVTYIASSFTKNVRSLEGALTTLVGIIHLYPDCIPVTSEYAQKTLHDLSENNVEIKVLSISYIQEFISSYFNIKKDDLISSKRTKNIAEPRLIAMYLCKELTNQTFNEIAVSFVKKDHTSAIYAHKTISEKYQKNEKFKLCIDEIKKRLLE